MKALVFGAIALLALPSKCGSSDEPIDPASVPGSVVVNAPERPSSTTDPVLMTAQPVSAFVDAGPEDKSPFEQAKDYHAHGQNWLARLLVEKHALSADGTKDEAELLLEICKAQNDGACVQECAKKLGRKIAFDGGVSAAPAVTAERPSETNFTKARDLHLKKRDKEARALLEPRVIEGKATPEEVGLLSQICTLQKDKLCVALCKKQ